MAEEFGGMMGVTDNKNLRSHLILGPYLIRDIFTTSQAGEFAGMTGEIDTSLLL